MENPLISIKSNDRTFITGMTGSGKTYLAHFLCKSLPRLIVIDTKGTLKNWNCDPWDYNTKHLLTSDEPVRIRVQPPIEIESVPKFIDEIFLACYKATNCTIYIDEVYGVIPPGRDASSVLFGLFTRGRELGVGVISASQRPSWLPLVAISESEHMFCFYLQLIEDRKRMAAFMGEDVLSLAPDQYGFYYYRSGSRTTQYFKRLEVANDEINLKTVKIIPDNPPRKRLLNFNFGGSK